MVGDEIAILIVWCGFIHLSIPRSDRSDQSDRDVECKSNFESSFHLISILFKSHTKFDGLRMVENAKLQITNGIAQNKHILPIDTYLV